MAKGKVWLVGAGAGEPGLITVRGLEVLRHAEVVLYDALAHPALLEACSGAELHHVGKRYGEDSAVQVEINRQLVDFARAGKRVVRLKGGDPFMFARGAEEALALAEAGIEFEIVPGVSSPVAASAYAGISLTHRDLSSSVTFITGSDRVGVEWSAESWRKLATATDTICVLMGMRRIEEITRALIDGGRAETTPAAVIQWGARPEQRVVRASLAEIAKRAREAGLKNPAIILVGEVATLRERLAWYDSRPLSGRKLVLPRPLDQGRDSARQVRERGAEAVLLPMIEIGEAPDRAAFSAAVARLGDYDWLLFTSSNAVEQLRLELRQQKRDARAFGRARVAVVGPKTAEALEAFGITPDLVAQEFAGEGLAKSLIEDGRPGRALLLRALVAREVLPEQLRAHGFDVDVVTAYVTQPLRSSGAELRARILAGEVDALLFTSGSTVSATLDALGADGAELLSKTALASIGPVTTKVAEARGLTLAVKAEVSTIDGLLDALEVYFRSSSGSVDDR